MFQILTEIFQILVTSNHEALSFGIVTVVMRTSFESVMNPMQRSIIAFFFNALFSMLQVCTILL